jgi:hypothetical protein
MVFYDYDTNYIFVRPLKSKHAISLNARIIEVISLLTKRGFIPKYWILDNEISDIVKDSFQTLSIKYQLVPPGMHRANSAERSIQTFKHHLIATMLGLDDNFPKHLWDTLLPQTEATLNMLRASRIHPQLSAYTSIHGNFDYNKTPLAPPGCRVVLHEKPNKRNSWSPAGIDGWYIGPSMDHYRCYKCYIPRTKGFRDCDTVDFFPKHTTLKPLTMQEQIMDKLQELVILFKQHSPKASTEFNDNNDITPTIPKVLNTDPFNRSHSKLQDTLVPHKYNTRFSKRNAALSPRVQNNGTLPRVPKALSIIRPPTILSVQHNLQPSDNITKRHAPIELESQWYANSVVDDDTGQTLEYRHLIGQDKYKNKYEEGMCRELGRLTGGYKNTPGTNTMTFITRNKIPPGRQCTYLRIVCTHKPNKADQYRVRLCAGGDRLTYDGEIRTPTADLTTVKIHLNSTISTRGGRYMTADVKKLLPWYTNENF